MRLTGTAQFTTNSRHHQAVRVPGDGFRVAARTSDGIIEALDATFPHPFFTAVQWHPENLNDNVSYRLFATLVVAARDAEAMRP